MSFALKFEPLVINPQEGLTLRTPEVHRFAHCGPCPMRQVRDDMPNLGRSRHTLASSNGLSDRADRDRSGSVIQSAINARDMPLLSMHPLEQGADLIQCQGGRQPPDKSTWISFGRRGAFVPSFPTPRSPSARIQDKG